jgi:hypothetical protein
MSDYVSKTARRIERDKKKWDEFAAKHSDVGNFFKEYRLGFPKKIAIIQHDGKKWIGSGNDPLNKVYGRTAEEVVKKLLLIL